VSPIEAMARKYKPVRRVARFLVEKFDLPPWARTILAPAVELIPFDHGHGPTFRRPPD
jgi:hypothetical protein